MVPRPRWVAVATLAALLAVAAGASAHYHDAAAPGADTDPAPTVTSPDATPAQAAADVAPDPGADGDRSRSGGSSGSSGSPDGYRDGSDAAEEATAAVADDADPEPVPDAATGPVDAGGEPAGAQVQVLSTPRCKRGRLMGVTLAYPAVATPEAVPWSDWFREGRWYWGIDNPWDQALSCLDPDESAPVPGDAPAEVGAAEAPLPSTGPKSPADTTRPAPDPANHDEDPSTDEDEVRRSSDIQTAAYRSPPPGYVDSGAAALVLAALAIPAAAALYRRLTHDELLENETRATIYELVVDEPGLTAAEASERLDVHYRTARHHLEKLAEFGKIVGKRIQGRIRYFENHQRYGLIQKRLISCLESETKREVLMEIARSGAVRSGEVADRVDVAPSTASHHLGDLEDEDLVAARREGRSVLYRLEDGVLPALLDLAPLGDDEAAHTG